MTNSGLVFTAATNVFALISLSILIFLYAQLRFEKSTFGMFLMAFFISIDALAALALLVRLDRLTRFTFTDSRALVIGVGVGWLVVGVVALRFAVYIKNRDQRRVHKASVRPRESGTHS